MRDPEVDLNQEELAAQLEARVAETVGRINQGHIELVAIAAQAKATGAWAGPGLRSLAHWLTWQAGVSRGTARRIVDVVEARESHPRLTEVFERGELTLDQMAVAVTAPDHLDAEFASLAPRCTVAQIRIMVRAASPPPDLSDPDRPAESVSIDHDQDGSGEVRARLEADNLALFDAALRAARDRLFLQGQTDVTNVDALIDLCRRSLDAEVASRRERFRIGVFLDPNDPVRARWSNGTAVPDAIRRYVTCEGWLSPIFTQHGRAVSVGRSQRIVPERTRLVVLHRDGGRCRMPWCDRSYGLEIHHVVHWEDGGPTDTANLVTVCRSCHRRHHLGEFHLTGNADDPDGLVVTDRHGRPITRPTPKPPDGPAPPATRYRHPLGERLDTSQLWFPPPPTPHDLN